jgi:hypothetical protein
MQKKIRPNRLAQKRRPVPTAVDQIQLDDSSSANSFSICLFSIIFINFLLFVLCCYVAKSFFSQHLVVSNIKVIN